MLNAKNKDNKLLGFTLIELSIVLVIIGLIVSSVLAGKSLLESARMRSQVSQLKELELAYNAFKLRYNAVPGDFARASDFFVGVTNGNGDGRITHDADRASDIGRENIKLFEHLSRAGLVKNVYSIVWALDRGYPSLKLDDKKGMIAAGRIRSATYLTSHQVSVDFIVTAALALNVGLPSLGGSEYNNIAVATPITMFSVDKKIDDGITLKGRYITYRDYNGTEGNCLDAVDGEYLLSNSRVACNSLFILEK